MTNTEPVWLSPQAYEQLQKELAAIRELFCAAAADGDTDENSAGIRCAWQMRTQQIHDVLVNAVVGEDPPYDGIAEPGMV